MAAESTKGKGVLAVSISPPAVERREDSSPAALSHTTMPARNASSKYDFVKVKVWLGDNADHYYVLSRFLLSRMLTVTKVKRVRSLAVSMTNSSGFRLDSWTVFLLGHYPESCCHKNRSRAQKAAHRQQPA